MFYIALATAIAFGIAFAISTKGIFYATPNTDNELMAYAAAQSHKWRWLSDVHKYSASTRKVSMKEWTVILLSVFQKIFRDKKSDWPYVTMTGTAVSVCTVLIYLIATNYFSPTVGLIASVLYIISFWPWQVALQGGHANIANLFFLLSAYSIQVSYSDAPPSIVMLIAGGAFLGLCLFSSPSSHKYFLAVFSALFFSQYRILFESGNTGKIIDSLPASHLWIPSLVIMAAFAFVGILVLVTYKRVIKNIYRQKTPDFINKIISGKDHFPLEHYINHANKKIKIIIRWSFWTLLSLLILINLIPLPTLLLFATGFIFVLLMILLPNVKENVVEYFACMLEHKKKTHFRDYVEFFAKRGIMVQRNTRGAGLSWIPKLLWLFIPFHASIFVVAFVFAQYRALNVSDARESILLLLLTFVSLSPIIWAEITKAPQASRLYSPSLITILLLPAYVLFNIHLNTSSAFLLSGFLFIAFIWNFQRFSTDVYPARMTVRSFMQTIKQLGIKEIYTYKTNFNMPFVYAIPGIGKSEYLPEDNISAPLKVNYIKKLDEVTDGWIAIPGTSGKAVSAAGFLELEQDYTDDPILNRIIETKQIEKIAYKKFKTYGTSTIWINEDDITSYRSLHLKDIKPKDIYRGHAWLIHSDKIQNAKIKM